MKKKIELLAPAGDLERAKVAIRYGADAVYLGGKRFSLRSRSSNFDLADIQEAVEFANRYGSAVHVTVNIIPHDEDLDGLSDYLRALEAAGVTAIIAASPTIITTARKVAPKLEVHLSTQMSSTNLDCVRFYQEMGVSRVVLGRECSMQQIRYLSQNSPLEIEAFIHGGMCVNYSGRCTLSNAMTLRDANRGGCAQSCRWKYHIYQNDTLISDPKCPFSMSSKDLLAFRFIPDLIEAKVASLKIEGRMKSAYYIATVVKTYRMLIDEVLANPGALSPSRVAYYEKEFAKAENRPTCTGFLDHLPDHRDHLYGVNGSGVTHDFLALVLDYDEEAQQAVLQVRNRFLQGELLEAFGPHVDNRQFLVEEIYNDQNERIECCNKPMEIVRIAVPFALEAGDMIRRGGIAMICFEGAVSVKAVLLNGKREIAEIWIDEKKKDRDIAFILRSAKQRGVAVKLKSREEIDRQASGKTHGGVLAFGGPRKTESLEDVLHAPNLFLALLEGIEDPFNLGYALRSLYAAGCHGVLLRPRDWSRVESTIVKSSAGASEAIAIFFEEDLNAALEKARSAGCRIYAAMRKDAIDYFDADFTGPLLLAIGGEMRGLTQAVLSQSDQNVMIPYANDFRNALNASGAVAALSFEIVRQRRK